MIVPGAPAPSSTPESAALTPRRARCGGGAPARIAAGLAWLALAGGACSGARAGDAALAQGAPGGPDRGAHPSLDAAAAPAPAGPSAKVRVVFKTVPPTQATVMWGKKRLGIIKPKAPLIIERPRDSGPLDVVVRAEGCLPVHSRVYTFTDSVLAVKVTPPDKKNTLFGYREAPPPDEDAGAAPGSAADAGAP